MRPWSRLAALAAISFTTLGWQCDRRPRIPCDDVDLTVLPGTMVEISNPCFDRQWLDLPRVDGMRMIDAPQGTGITTERTGGHTIRSVVVPEYSQLFVRRPIRYEYGRGNTVGAGTIYLSTALPLAVTARAEPSLIEPGGSTQLLASVSEGIRPYTFLWSPSDSLDAANIENPVATPGASTTYQLLVSDAGGQFVTLEVPVDVHLVTTAAAFPVIVSAGEASQLVATASGGAPPYTYAWSPAETLDDPNSRTPTARPLATTTYEVTITDAAGYGVTRPVTVTVSGEADPAPLAARFTWTWDGVEGLDLDASASTGDIAAYEWDFSWEPLQTDLRTTTPYGAFYAYVDTVGTITLTVVDVRGGRSSTTVPFP